MTQPSDKNNLAGKTFLRLILAMTSLTSQSILSAKTQSGTLFQLAQFRSGSHLAERTKMFAHNTCQDLKRPKHL